MGIAIRYIVLTERLDNIYAYEELEKNSLEELTRAIELANRDALTGLESRSDFESCEASFNERIRKGENVRLSIVVCDANNLKKPMTKKDMMQETSILLNAGTS